MFQIPANCHDTGTDQPGRLLARSWDRQTTHLSLCLLGDVSLLSRTFHASQPVLCCFHYRVSVVDSVF